MTYAQSTLAMRNFTLEKSMCAQGHLANMTIVLRRPGGMFTDYRSLDANLLSLPQVVTCLLAGGTASDAAANQSGQESTPCARHPGV